MADEPGPRGRPQRIERRRRPAEETRPTQSGRPRRGPWGRGAENCDDPPTGRLAEERNKEVRIRRILVATGSSASHTLEAI